MALLRIKWLNDNDIAFCIRIKKNSKVTNRFGQSVQVHTLLRQVMVGECFMLNRIVTVDGVINLTPIKQDSLKFKLLIFISKIINSILFNHCRVNKVKLFAHRNKDNELMIVATNDLSQIDGIALYAKRWEIETLFSCFKGRGFDLEETHLTNQKKMQKLVAVFAIAFCWCYKIGIKHNQETPIKRKKHGRLSKSLFRLGLDIFQETMRKVIIFHQSDKFYNLLRYITDNNLGDYQLP